MPYLEICATKMPYLPIFATKMPYSHIFVSKSFVPSICDNMFDQSIYRQTRFSIDRPDFLSIKNLFHRQNRFSIDRKSVLSIKICSTNRKSVLLNLIMSMQFCPININHVIVQFGNAQSYLIFVLFSPQTKFLAQFFSTQKRVNSDKTDFATKQRKSHKREILQQNSIKCDKTSKIVHIIYFVHNILIQNKMYKKLREISNSSS